MGLKKRIIWYPTLRCNKACPYCYEREWPDITEQVPQTWQALFNRIDRGQYIDISGGEPTLYPDFVPTVKEMVRRHHVYLTTNLTDVDTVLALADDLAGLTVSYHPHSTNKWEFLVKAKQIQEVHPELVVNIVLYPDIIAEAKTVIDQLNLLNLRWHAEPYIYPGKPYSEEEKQQVRELAGTDRILGWPEHFYHPTRDCDIGMRQEHWMPNGDVYICGTYLMLYLLGAIAKDKGFYLGNLFDGSYRPMSKSVRCSMPCIVGCDVDSQNDIWGLWG